MAYDPSTGTVDQVNAYLAEHPDERAQVLADERAGKARLGILGGPYAEDAAGDAAPADTAQGEPGTAESAAPVGDVETTGQPDSTLADQDPEQEPDPVGAPLNADEAATEQGPDTDGEGDALTPNTDLAPPVQEAAPEGAADDAPEDSAEAPTMAAQPEPVLEGEDYQRGYAGTSPGVEATGKADQGLSLASVLGLDSAPLPTGA